MKKTIGYLPLVFLIISHFGMNSPSLAQSVERPAYIVVATMTPRGETVLQNISGRLSSKGFTTKITPLGDRLALLVGPYTSPDDFNSAVERVTAAWREPAQRVPFFFENAPLLASGSQEHVTSGTVTSSPKPQPSAGDTVKWVREFTDEHPVSVLDAEFFVDVMKWNHECMPGWWSCYNELEWSSVRRITLKGNTISILAEIDAYGRCCEDNRLGKDFTSGKHWMSFKLTDGNSQEEDAANAERLFRAVKHLIELQGADLSEDKTF